jgi:hypothetical protein
MVIVAALRATTMNVPVGFTIIPSILSLMNRTALTKLNKILEGL